jgi:hypothetical protein
MSRGSSAMMLAAVYLRSGPFLRRPDYALYSAMYNGREPHRSGAFQKRQPPTLIFRVHPGCAAAPVHIMV